MNTDKDYEAELLRSFEKGKWKPVKNLKKQLAAYSEALTATWLKN